LNNGYLGIYIKNDAIKTKRAIIKSCLRWGNKAEGVKSVREEMIERILSDFLILVPLLNKKILRESELYKLDDLYPSHVQILLLLSKNKQLTMSEISREIHVINSNLTPLVDKLIKLGYLKRQPSKKDRRVVHISLTASGKKQVEKHKQYAVLYLKEQFEQLDEPTLEALQEHLGEVNRILEPFI